MAVVSASASSGATLTPPPDSASNAGTAVPASIEATSGRPAASVEYVFDGTLTWARPRCNGDDVDVAGGEQLDEAPFGHVAPEADVGQSGGRGAQVGQPGALAVDRGT